MGTRRSSGESPTCSYQDGADADQTSGCLADRHTDLSHSIRQAQAGHRSDGSSELAICGTRDLLVRAASYFLVC